MGKTLNCQIIVSCSDKFRSSHLIRGEQCLAKLRSHFRTWEVIFTYPKSFSVLDNNQFWLLPTIVAVRIWTIAIWLWIIHLQEKNKNTFFLGFSGFSDTKMKRKRHLFWFLNFLRRQKERKNKSLFLCFSCFWESEKR